MEQKNEIQEEKRKEDRAEKALKWYDRHKQTKRLIDLIKRLTKRFQKKGTTQAEEPLESTPEEPIETQEIPQAEAGAEAETGAGTEGIGEGEIGAETGIEGGAEIGAETTGAELAGTEAGSIIETAAAESAGAEALGAGMGAEIGGAGITTGAELGATAGLEVGAETGFAAATGVGAGEATAGMGAVGAAGAVGAEGAAIVGGGAGVAAAGAGGAGAAAAGAGGAVAIGGGVVAAESNPVGWIITAVILVIVIFVVLIIILTGGGGTGSANPTPTPNPTTSIASCPVPGGTVYFGSYQADSANGHCGTNYPGTCDPNSRRAKSIDVLTGGVFGKNIVLPSIQGQIIEWKYLGNFPVGDDECTDPNLSDTTYGICGRGMVFNSSSGWTLHLVHMGTTFLKIGETYPSGTEVGKSAISHVHITIGKNIANPENPPAGGTDLDPGWLAADQDAGMCVTKSNTCTQQYEGTGPCTPSNLMSYFGNDSTKALIASLICQAESCSNQQSFNNACLTGGSLDYSIGLFQINALAHCGDPQPFSYTSNPPSCTVINQAALDTCKTRLFSAEGNIQAAVGVSNNGTNWTQWSTWTIPNACGIGVINVLNKCGIKY